MKEELILPQCRYPWPTIPSPIANAFDEEEKAWYDNDYTFISEEGIKRCKPQFLSRVATYMNPTCDSMERMRPCARLMIYITLFDDFFGMTPANELKIMADRVYEVMMGEDPHEDEIGILRQMAQARKEWETFMPRFWIDRVSINFYEFIMYGMMEEIPFKQAENRTYPLLAHYLSFRKYSIGMWPYGDLIDPAVNYALPVHIYNHPIIQRCRELLSLIIVIQNDFASLKKELEIESESLNIIFILRHQYKISYQEACTEAMKLHDAYAQELDDLHQSLPDFGSFQEEAYNHVYHIKLQISGCPDWYYNSGTSRYEHKAFIVPQYGREGDDIIIPHSIFIKE
ncbi:terpene synthase family protein [Chryseobacterium jejuense]|uniref:terpene synthase family protein n=1 Tax=Chryseobacterium jejuense TaxID=445960 RepID=UPI001AE28C47|nr:hypothetical protein [Chryseobacterium jejuense]MBP2614932.1 hypothetical protein [Chryseobacterium jejuense]